MAEVETVAVQPQPSPHSLLMPSKHPQPSPHAYNQSPQPFNQAPPQAGLGSPLLPPMETADPGKSFESFAQNAKIERLQKQMWLQTSLLVGVLVTQVVVGIILAGKVDDFVERGTKTADDADVWMAAMMETGNGLKATADDAALTIKATSEIINTTAKHLNETADEATSVIKSTSDVISTTATKLNQTADDATATIRSTGHVISQTADVINDTAQTITNPSAAAGLISGTFSTMMLGNPDGSLAAYLQDMTENDYPGIASNVQPLSNYIRDAMKIATAGKDCDPAYVSAPCPDNSNPTWFPYGYTCTTGAVGEYRSCYCAGGTTYDPNSGSYVCNTGGWQQDCTPDKPKECVMEKISNVAAVVSSVLDKAKTLEKVTPEHDIGNPAMSNGLLRLNWLANWTMAQGGTKGVQAYKTLSKQCKSLVANVLNINGGWRGSFNNAAGERKDWDVQANVVKVTDWVTMFCNALE